MTKLLLVDDEDFIRQGMRYAIPWEDYDIEVTEASNGQEALDIALRIKPDIVLTDIQMPVMNGLELAKQLQTTLPDTHVIILTAYGNTDNLIHAIDVKVSGFIVKSADSQKILDSVLKEQQELNKKKMHSEKLHQIQDIYNENQLLIKSTLLSRYLTNQTSYSHFAKKAERLGMRIDHTPFCLAVLKCNCSDEKRAISQFLYAFQEYSPICYMAQDNVAVLLLDLQTHIFSESSLEQIFPGIQPFIFGNFFTAMAPVASFDELPMAYRILMHSLENCFWNTGSPYTLLSTDTPIVSDRVLDPYPYESNIMRTIFHGSADSVSSAFDEYFAYMKEQQASRNYFLDSVLRLIVFISSVSEDAISVSQLKEITEETETPEEILELVKSLTLPVPSAASSNTQIETAITYMKAHFSGDLYLDDVAKAVFLSPGYLCRIFKSETGYSFKEYLHKLRIEKAQQLILDTDYKYYEIAEMVGYKNYKYFSSYFNKITGCSAKEYRQANLHHS